MFRASGNFSRMGIVAAGYYAFVIVTERPDGRWAYTVQRISDEVNFPVPKILAELNFWEEKTGTPDKWGGGDTVGGSPRISGSALSPETVAKVIDTVLAQC